MSRPGARKGTGWALGLMFFVCFLGFTAWSFASPACGAEPLAAGFARFGDLEKAGVSSAELPAIARAIAGYLKGERPSAQVRVVRQGTAQDAFSQREMDHMPDVKRLIDVARFLWRMGLMALAVIAAAALRAALGRDAAYPKIMGKSLLEAALSYLVLLAALVIWAMADFTGLFYRLHECLFPNDFWLLDPERHLMIQLMPETFFADYALFALRRLAWLLLVFPLAFLLLRWPNRKAEK
jgi:integral membrane protein (TIGR01906 family)